MGPDVSDTRGGCGLDDPGDVWGQRREQPGLLWEPGASQLGVPGSRPGLAFLTWLGLGSTSEEGSRDPSCQRAGFSLVLPTCGRCACWEPEGRAGPWRPDPAAFSWGSCREPWVPSPAAPGSAEARAAWAAGLVQGRACSPLLPLTQVGTSNLAPLAQQPGRDEGGPQEGQPAAVSAEPP